MPENEPEKISLGLTDVSVKRPASPDDGGPKPFLFHILVFFALLCLWVILSGKFDLFHLSLGIISCAIVTAFSGDLLFSESGTRIFFRHGLRVLGYIPWLLYQVALANFHILYLVFHPKMMDLIDPQIIRFESSLKKEISLVTFANSITLTPGTITMYVSVGGAFQVHAIDRKSGEPLPGEMERRVARTFEEV